MDIKCKKINQKQTKKKQKSIDFAFAAAKSKIKNQNPKFIVVFEINCNSFFFYICIKQGEGIIWMHMHETIKF
jgi:hypothetical protein